ncbi:MAG: stilbene synthase [Deltaproteobacteria bacterium]|nr:MAG: stilbene synthase [Deltaproteobacteria bacterium]
MTVAVCGFGTALPPHELRADEARAFVERRLVARRPELARMLGVFDRAGVETRRLCAPLDFFTADPSFAAKQAEFARTAPALATAAAERALADAGHRPRDVAAVVVACSTGVAAPNLDRDVAVRLELTRDVRRAPLWGLGCAGGVAALALAADLARARCAPILAVAVETCSLAFLPSDTSRANLIACALFGDGAAAVVLAPGNTGPVVRGAATTLVPDTADAMGWDVVDEGLKVRFAPTLPGLVRRHVGGALDRLATEAAVRRFDRFALHPGGPKILAAYDEVLAPPEQDLAASREILRTCGNMSSPTALFVLDRIRRTHPPAPGTQMAVAALGPGLAIESVALQW